MNQPGKKLNMLTRSLEVYILLINLHSSQSRKAPLSLLELWKWLHFLSTICNSVKRELEKEGVIIMYKIA